MLQATQLYFINYRTIQGDGNEYCMLISKGGHMVWKHTNLLLLAHRHHQIYKSSVDVKQDCLIRLKAYTKDLASFYIKLIIAKILNSNM